MNVGEVIKLNRIKKGLTQKQLAYQLRVSSAAVCKWEMGLSNPDISLLVPIAKLFGISVDHLLGNDQEFGERTKVNEVLENYQFLLSRGLKIEAFQLIAKAKLDYPNNFAILIEYCWSIVGGRNHLDRKLIARHSSALSVNCERILNECSNERIRSDALLIKAEIMYVSGAPTKAIDLLSNLPSWDGVAEQKIELLYSCDTKESLYWTTRNLYCLSDGVASKAFKSIWSDVEASSKIKIGIVTEMADMVFHSWEKTKHVFFLVMSHMMYSILAKKEILIKNPGHCVIETIHKELETALLLSEISKRDSSLSDLIQKTYKTNSLIQWTIQHYESYSCSLYSNLRKKKTYKELIINYRKKAGIQNENAVFEAISV